MADKPFQASHGILLDHNFVEHCRVCAKCLQFDPDKPTTAALMCLEGAVLWKRDNAVRERREAPPRHDHYASKAEVKRLMRYKGE